MRDDTMPAVRCKTDTKKALVLIAENEGVPLSVIQRRAFEFFLQRVNTNRIDIDTQRHDKRNGEVT